VGLTGLAPSGPAHLHRSAGAWEGQSDRPVSPRSTTDELRGRAPCPARCWLIFLRSALRRTGKVLVLLCSIASCWRVCNLFPWRSDHRSLDYYFSSFYFIAWTIVSGEQVYFVSLPRYRWFFDVEQLW
jgi:hypothetical protein